MMSTARVAARVASSGSETLCSGQWSPPLKNNCKADADHLCAGFSTGAGVNMNKTRDAPEVEGEQVNIRNSCCL